MTHNTQVQARARHRMRTLVMGGVLLVTTAVSVPLISSAQEGTPGSSPASDNPAIEQGRMIYQNVCIACHQPDGKGIEGIYLPLAGNPAITLDDPTYLITVLLNGRGGMPTFAGTYSDEEIAAVATYIRQEWGNAASPVTAEQVAAVRASIMGTPAAQPTPEGQVPSGIATPDATPGASPAT